MLDPTAHRRLLDCPVFLTGFPRSGTTLMLALLDSHPDLLVLPRETHFFDEILPCFRQDPAAATAMLAQQATSERWFVPGLYESGRLVGQLEENFRACLAQMDGSARSLLEALVLAHGSVTQQLGRRFWIEKTPFNERYARTIFDWFPAARLIYMVRDPRATFASYRAFRATQGGPPLDVWSFCLRWAASLATAKRLARRRAVLLVRYEDVVNTPELAFERICRFLTIEPGATLLRPTLSGSAFVGNSSYSWGATRMEGIDSSSLGKWAEVLTAAEVQRLELLLASPMRQLEYSPSRSAVETPALFTLRYAIPFHLMQRVLTELGMLGYTPSLRRQRASP